MPAPTYIETDTEAERMLLEGDAAEVWAQRMADLKSRERAKQGIRDRAAKRKAARVERRKRAGVA